MPWEKCQNGGQSCEAEKYFILQIVKKLRVSRLETFKFGISTLKIARNDKEGMAYWGCITKCEKKAHDSQSILQEIMSKKIH